MAASEPPSYTFFFDRSKKQLGLPFNFARNDGRIIFLPGRLVGSDGLVALSYPNPIYSADYGDGEWHVLENPQTGSASPSNMVAFHGKIYDARIPVLFDLKHLYSKLDGSARVTGRLKVGARVKVRITIQIFESDNDKTSFVKVGDAVSDPILVQLRDDGSLEIVGYNESSFLGITNDRFEKLD